LKNQNVQDATGSSKTAMSTAIQVYDTPSLISDATPVAVISPDEQRRNAATIALGECPGIQIREFISFPAEIENVSRMLGADYDVVLIDLDSDPEYALELLEGICLYGHATPIVYSAQADPDLLVRCMHAGAREYLMMPFRSGEMTEALVRASALRSVVRAPKQTGGRLLVFLSAKGGSGVTTLACNYAVSLAEESRKKTLLIDLNLPLGDAAISLGIKAEYSTLNALQNFSRLDSNLLSSMLVQHSSGLFVLAAPTELIGVHSSDDAVDMLLKVACQDFDYVVVDAGSRFDLQHTNLFDKSATIYLVTQVGISELRNSNRLITKLSGENCPKLEIVVNRYDPHSQEIDETQLTKALTKRAEWKIPNNYKAVRRMQNTAISLMEDDSPISQAIRKMTRSVSGQPAVADKKEKKRIFSFFR
jgi:pilus assembly protein CpaE